MQPTPTATESHHTPACAHNTPSPPHLGKDPHPAAGGIPSAQADDDRFADFVASLQSATPDEEYDLLSCPTSRFDPPAPIQLETRGVTEHLILQAKGPLPLWEQSEFWSAHTAHKNAIAAKLRQAGRRDLADKLEQCHTQYTFTVCRDCGRQNRFPNRCDTFYCAECQPRLSHDRKLAIGWWTKLITQPKHIVLTARNITDMTQGHVKELKKWFKKLRLRKFSRNWEGGFYAIEVTNEGTGWHLHIHALVNAKWIDASELSRQWCSVTNGAGHIVKVRDARPADYLRELTKYVAKGSQIAAWTPDQIRTFVEAFDGVRTFGVFGSLYGARTKFAEFIATLRDAKPKCECGSCNIAYYTESEFIALDLQPAHQYQPRPPTNDQLQETLALNDSNAYNIHK